ncbi:MAG: 3-carboxy-cis,cis-muconate cycloisomerase [Geminicoccaceae bacterium]
MRPRVFEPLLTDSEIAVILGDAAMVQAMVRVESTLAEVEGGLGVIDAGAAERIVTALATFAPDLDDLAHGTAKAGVPIPALVAQLRRAVGDDADCVHWGATSQDIVDTALVLQLRRALDVLERRLDAVGTALADLAVAQRATTMIGRTRFQQALPTTFGLKVAGWLAPLPRHRERLAELRPRLLAVQFGGAAGNLAALGPSGIAVMQGLASALGLACPAMPWHSQRDTMAELASWLALLTGTLGKLGLDVLLLAQNEVGEVREAEGGGSSTMPQKSNPIRAEALVALARRNAALLGGMYDAMLHAHERDGAAWQVEWQVLPDMVAAAAAALTHADTLARTLVVDADRMRQNLAASHGLLLAEAASFALADHLPRAAAKKLVEEGCRDALASRRDLLDILAERTSAPVEWDALRAQAERPPCADALIDRVLVSIAGRANPEPHDGRPNSL